MELSSLGLHYAEHQSHKAYFIDVQVVSRVWYEESCDLLKACTDYTYLPMADATQPEHST